MNGFFWIYLILIAFLVAHELARREGKKRDIYYGAVFFLFLMFALQDCSVSIDIAEYMRQYAIIPGLSVAELLTHKFEPGFVLLCWLLRNLFTSERVLLVVVGAVILFPFGMSLRRTTPNAMIALVAFLALGMYMHAIIFWRQFMAMALLTFSYRYIQERKFFPFLLIVLLAMSFHKVSVVFIGLYFVYNVPISKWLVLACAVLSGFLAFLGPSIIEFGIRVIYPRYKDIPRLNLGGGTLLALLWVVTILSYFVFHKRMNEKQIRLPFLMVLIAAVIQPVCFAYYNWFRVVLFFRVALVPMTALLFQAMFEQTSENVVLQMSERIFPRFSKWYRSCIGKKGFVITAQLLMFAVLFVWYVSELEGTVYIMAPIG